MRLAKVYIYTFLWRGVTTECWTGNIFGVLRVCLSVLSVLCALQLCVALVETECLFAADAGDSYSKRKVSRLDYINANSVFVTQKVD